MFHKTQIRKCPPRRQGWPSRSGGWSERQQPTSFNDVAAKAADRGSPHSRNMAVTVTVTVTTQASPQYENVESL